jgi:hypothetical protein
MGLHQEAQQTFEHHCRFDNDYDAISAVRLEKDDVTYNISDMGGNIIGIPTDNNGLRSAYIMGDPGKRSSHSQNREEPARTWGASDLTVNIERENRIDTHIRNLPRTDHPSVEACPYVLEGDSSPPSTPSGRCKSPFVPSFKDVTKMLTFPSSLCAKVDAFIERLNRWSRNADGLVEHFWAHMKLGESMSETVWGKLSLGTKIVAQGGVEKMFKSSFIVGPTEKLLKTSACYLSTSSDPVAGLLFISTEKVAFCSDRSLSFTSSQGENASSYYRVVIPLGRVRSVNLCENVEKATEKYIQIQTVDDHDFWFMAFVNYQKAFKHLQRAVISH